MTPSFVLWNGLRLLLLAWYAVALSLAVSAQPLHGWVVFILILLAVHLLEIPHAMRVLQGRPIGRAHLVLHTLLFGVLWWFPVERRILAP
jgi:hypothetical protein